MTATLAELETKLLRALQQEWRDINWQLFGDTLRPPVLSLTDREGTLGEWVGSTREIRIQRKMAFEQPWGVVEDVLEHEMAHQFVQEVLLITDETAHGPAFREVCAARGIDARASGTPDAGEGGSRVIAKVTKLLALATSANQNEAETAMAKAQALMRAHNVDAVQAKTPRAYTYRHLGTPKGRIYEPTRWLATIVTNHFFVDGIWVRVWQAKKAQWGQVLEVCGTPENLAIAEYVWGFLEQTAERLWAAHKAAQGIKADKDRRRFLTGVMRGFLAKLNRQQVQADQSAKALVWSGDPQLARYMKRRHPRTRTVSHGSSADGAAFRAGRAAGESIVLNKPMEGGGEARGRLLGSGS